MLAVEAAKSLRDLGPPGGVALEDRLVEPSAVKAESRAGVEAGRDILWDLAAVVGAEPRARDAFRPALEPVAESPRSGRSRAPWTRPRGCRPARGGGRFGKVAATQPFVCPGSPTSHRAWASSRAR
jgi:hypothetical protein